MKRLVGCLSLAVIFTAGLATKAAAGPFSALVVYGDSLSDNGNLFSLVGFPPAPYFQGRFSNGPVAVEQLAANLAVPLVDFAVGGATTGLGDLADGGTPSTLGSLSIPGMQTQLAATQGSLGPFLSNGLFVVWGGPNDLFQSQTQAAADHAVADIVAIVTSLQLLGAHHILVPNLPDLGRAPADLGQAALYSGLTTYFNTELAGALPPGVTRFDTFALFNSLFNNPAAYGLTNVTSPCFTGVPPACANPNQFLFWDGVHPTTAVDTIIANALEATVVPEPSTLVLAASGLVLVLARRRRSSES